MSQASNHPPAVPAADNHDLNEASVTVTDEGRVALSADLDQVSGEKVLVALDALSRPIPAPDGSRDPRSRSRRLADGLVEMVLSPRAARELRCGDNELAAIVMADGVPLSISANQRLATGPVRAALNARDHGCQFPGCGRPTSWAHAHHIKEWAEGGETVLENLCLLCAFHHHTAVHAQGWRVRIGSDGHPWFQAPEGGEWMPCHNRRSPGLTLAA